MSQSTRVAALVGGALLASGCYSYRDLDTSVQPPSGTHVRIELSDAGAANLAKSIGPYVLHLEGQVASAERDGITLTVASLQRRGERDVPWTGDALVVSRSDIRYIAQRQRSNTRTAIAASAFTAVGVGLIVSIARATGLVSGGPNRPGPSNP